MKQLFVFLLVCAALSGCHTTKSATQVVTTTNHDTLYLNKLQYDSIFITQEHYLDRSKDTIVIRNSTVEYRYRLLRDTILKSKVDSIPVIKEVEVTKEVKYVPWYDKALAWIGVICLLIFALYIVYKTIKVNMAK